MQLLDNPVWQALNSADGHFNLGNEIVGYFDSDISPFVALPVWSVEMQSILYEQLPAGRSWSVMLNEPVRFSAEWKLTFTTSLYQMICPVLTPVNPGKADFRLLNVSDVPAMLALTALTRPGPFAERTIEFGNYYGVFENEVLVAISGERLHLDAYTEVSAVCTHPDHTGKGYAAFLVSFIAEQIIQQNKTPFLHVRSDNERAINMYKRLGFIKRSDMYFGKFTRS